MIIRQWENLLLPGETDIPEKVLCCISFFEKNNLFYRLSRNSPAYGCLDASKKRNRNNKYGISLADELKTGFFEFQSLRKQLEVKRSLYWCSQTSLDIFGIHYSEINPFIIYEKLPYLETIQIVQDVIFLFDKNLSINNQSMMTNAGELTWGIEF